MRRPLPSFLAGATSLTALAVMLTTLTTRELIAADDCVTQPNFQRTGSGHWYYRFDRVKQRKCWYLQQPDGKVSEAASPETQSPPKPGTQPPAPSFMSSLALTFAATGDPTAPEEPKNSDLPTTKSTPAGRPRGGVPGNGPSRMARHSSSEETPSSERHQQFAARARLKPPDRRTAPPDVETRDALFRQFLLWQERQSTNGAHLDAAGRDALFREFLLWQERKGTTRTGAP
jgi:hypothetical protein